MNQRLLVNSIANGIWWNIDTLFVEQLNIHGESTFST